MAFHSYKQNSNYISVNRIIRHLTTNRITRIAVCDQMFASLLRDQAFFALLLKWLPNNVSVIRDGQFRVCCIIY